MILVLVAGAAIGWQVRRIRTQQRAVATIRAAGGRVAYDFQFDLDPERMKEIGGRTEPPAPAVLRRWLGDDLFRTVASASLFRPIGPDEVPAVAALDGLIDLNIADTTGLTPGRLAEMTGGLRLAKLRLAGPRGNEPDQAEIDRLMATVGGIASLGEVTLTNLPVGDAALMHLGRLPKLKNLEVGICPNLTDEGMARGLAVIGSGLTTFGWSRGPKPIPRTLEALRTHHPHLNRLSLIKTPVDDADFAALGRLADLTLLNLQQTTITDAGLRHLAPLGRLRTLWINSPGITDAGMATVRGFADLEYLDLTWSRVGDAGLAELAGLTRLKTLRLGSAVTDAGMRHLAGLHDLEYLILDGAPLTDAALPPLAGLSHLKLLGLNGATITPAGAARLQATCPDADVLLNRSGTQMVPSPNRLRAIAAAKRGAGASGPQTP